jgi:hypothetical protein
LLIDVATPPMSATDGVENAAGVGKRPALIENAATQHFAPNRLITELHRNQNGRLRARSLVDIFYPSAENEYFRVPVARPA